MGNRTKTFGNIRAPHELLAKLAFESESGGPLMGILSGVSNQISRKRSNDREDAQRAEVREDRATEREAARSERVNEREARSKERALDRADRNADRKADNARSDARQDLAERSQRASMARSQSALLRKDAEKLDKLNRAMGIISRIPGGEDSPQAQQISGEIQKIESGAVGLVKKLDGLKVERDADPVKSAPTPKSLTLDMEFQKRSITDGIRALNTLSPKGADRMKYREAEKIVIAGQIHLKGLAAQKEQLESDQELAEINGEERRKAKSRAESLMLKEQQRLEKGALDAQKGAGIRDGLKAKAIDRAERKSAKTASTNDGVLKEVRSQLKPVEAKDGTESSPDIKIVTDANLLAAVESRDITVPEKRKYKEELKRREDFAEAIIHNFREGHISKDEASQEAREKGLEETIERLLPAARGK